MTENQNEPISQAGEVEVEVEAEAEVVEPAVPAKKPVRRGRIAAIAGAVLLVGAVVAGVGYTVVTVDGADRDAGAPVWKFPKTVADEKKAATAEGLAGVLVPYGFDGWNRGPDLAEFGSDVELSGTQATALRKESLSGLPRTERRQLEKEIDKQRITGMVMRSYVSMTGSSFTGPGVSTVSITLSRMEKRAAAKDISTSQNAFLDALDIFRAGPKIKGFKNAECFLPPKDADEDLDMMFCSAYQGDILISATADGAKPFDTKTIAKLLAEQLDRIAEPGEAV
ncbi:hypothetical protein OG864_28080 [Streptomyces sp. NBC_00124]|uniref:hypothetical protein n=1 Tax=Streptomyces sp. NBC_00124 TaxID=2975662 RepID=UPI00224DD621|nr:hypothetical protein [Streptomyces sp. NBC_00124]MCX5362559.1 hypothetical protein [Streptomyces sp. NBC_00124]